jgi:hypothetical protein
MDDGLNQKQDAFVNVPSWRAGIDLKFNVEETRPAKTLD